MKDFYDQIKIKKSQDLYQRLNESYIKKNKSYLSILSEGAVGSKLDDFIKSLTDSIFE